MAAAEVLAVSPLQLSKNLLKILDQQQRLLRYQAVDDTAAVATAAVETTAAAAAAAAAVAAAAAAAGLRESREQLPPRRWNVPKLACR